MIMNLILNSIEKLDQKEEITGHHRFQKQKRKKIV